MRVIGLRRTLLPLMMKMNGISLTQESIVTAEATIVGKKTPKAKGMIIITRIADIDRKAHSQESLSQNIQTVMPAFQKTTTITDTPQTTVPVRVSLTRAAVSVKRSLIAAEAIHFIKTVGKTLRRIHYNHELKKSCQITTRR